MNLSVTQQLDRPTLEKAIADWATHRLDESKEMFGLERFEATHLRLLYHTLHNGGHYDGVPTSAYVATMIECYKFNEKEAEILVNFLKRYEK